MLLLLSVTDEVELWSSTENAIESLIDYINRTDMAYPQLPEGRAVGAAAAPGVAVPSCSRGEKADGPPAAHDPEMYKGMFRTAIEMISQLRVEEEDA